MKKIAFLLVAAFSIIGLSAYTNANISEYEDVSEEHFEFDGQWKNLKVLPQDISKDSLMGLMRGYNVALGVKCNHCHVQDKASDEKHEKDIARHMIQFTDELNVKEFAPIGPKYAQAIECATCHRGATKVMEEINSFKESLQQEVKK